MDGALTIEKLMETVREVKRLSGPTVSNGLLYPFGGFQIYDNPFLVESEVYEETVQLTFRQRWIDPISTFRNFQTMPFEPWVKTRVETRTREIPSSKIFQTPQGLIMHPVMRREVEKKLRSVTEDTVPPFRNRYGV